MNKQEFITKLKAMLSDLPENEITERIDFYSEMIDDRIEDGLTEEDAVADLGSIEDIRAQIVKDTPITKIIKEKIKPKKRLRAWEIVLIVIGSPLWLPLLVVEFAVLRVKPDPTSNRVVVVHLQHGGKNAVVVLAKRTQLVEFL